MDDRLKLFILSVALMLILDIAKKVVGPVYFPFILFSLVTYFICVSFIHFEDVLDVKFLSSIFGFLFLVSMAGIIVYLFIHFKLDLLAAFLKR